MKVNTTYDVRPDAVELTQMANDLVLLSMRENIEEHAIEIETFTKTGKPKIVNGTQYTADEAYMVLEAADAPTVEEATEAFEDWYAFAEAWTPARVKTLAEIQADVEFIAAMSGIDLEV